MSAQQRALLAEFVGTAFLLLVIVGSGVASTDAQADAAQLLQHAVVIGAVLLALVAALGPVSGAHFNPAVSLVDAALGHRSWRSSGEYAAAQVAGAVVGVVVANLLFDLPAVAVAARVRSGGPLVLSEGIATFGLVVVIFATVRGEYARAIPAVVGAYVGAMVFSTSSTALMNPAVTLSRTLSDTWTGIRPVDTPAFVAVQIGAGLLAVPLLRAMLGPAEADGITTDT